MLNALLASLALVSGTSLTAHPPLPAAFSLVLESTVTGWRARCDSGCRWEQLSFDCTRACDAVVDANGMRTADTPVQESAAFRFRVHRTEAGVEATAVTGTTWTAVTWDCTGDSCRARVGGTGVSAVGPSR